MSEAIALRTQTVLTMLTNPLPLIHVYIFICMILYGGRSESRCQAEDAKETYHMGEDDRHPTAGRNREASESACARTRSGVP